MSDETLEELRVKLFWVDKLPISAHDCYKVEEILRNLQEYHRRICIDQNVPNQWYLGLTAAISYFETMGDFKAEQEHQDAFCTPIIEGS